MKTNKLGQEPAYPFTFPENEPTELNVGISKRFYAACAAMQGILANESLRTAILADERNGHPDLSGIAFEYADELLNKEK
jgi:hypothetical protein